MHRPVPEKGVTRASKGPWSRVRSARLADAVDDAGPVVAAVSVLDRASVVGLHGQREREVEAECPAGLHDVVGRRAHHGDRAEVTGMLTGVQRGTGGLLAAGRA